MKGKGGARPDVKKYGGKNSRELFGKDGSVERVLGRITLIQRILRGRYFINKGRCYQIYY